MSAFHRRARRDDELDEEIRAHLEMATRERIARGEDPVEAARNARREFGNATLVKEVTREAWGGAAVERIARDVRFAVRALRRAPAFTTATILTLGLAFGLVTTIFGVVSGIVLRPLPLPAPERLVALCERYPGATADWCGMSPPDAEDIANESRTIQAIGIARSWSSLMATRDGSTTLHSGIASPGVFRALGVAPERGRVLEPADLTGHPGNVAVISHAMWQTRFGGDPAIVGRVISLDKQPVTIVGVMPPGFSVPQLEAVELWRPLHFDPRNEENRDWRGFIAYTRLRPGVTLDAARADLDRMAASLRHDHFATTPDWGIALEPLRDLVVGGVRPTLYLFLGAVALVLLIACANIANLMLARGTARARELALRVALGAGRARLVRSVLVEALLLSLAGAALGLGLAAAGTAAFRRVAPQHLPRVADVHLDLRVLAFAMALAVVTTLVFGLVPALRAARVDVVNDLRAGARTTAGRGRLGGALVVVELATALVLLTGAGLLTRTFAAFSAWSPGFEQSHLLVFSLSASQGSYRTRPEIGTLWPRVEGAVRTIPGVLAVGTASGGPVFGGRETADVRPAGQGATRAETARWFDVSPGFFGALGVPIVRGRDLDARDREGAPNTVLINERAAHRYWGDANPVGRRITVIESGDTSTFTVVGVVRDVPALRPGTPPEPQLYWSNRQRPRWFTYVVARTSVPPSSIVPTLRHRLAAIDPDLDPSAPRTMPELVQRQLVDPRFVMLLLITFGTVALALAAIGTYGLLAYLVAQRRREIGIRLALGAWERRIVREVVAEGLRLAAAGLVLGGVAALAVGSTMAHLVAGVSPRDPLTLAVAGAVLTLVALAASALPALRASRVDPRVALHAE